MSLLRLYQAVMKCFHIIILCIVQYFAQRITAHSAVLCPPYCYYTMHNLLLFPSYNLCVHSALLCPHYYSVHNAALCPHHYYYCTHSSVLYLLIIVLCTTPYCALLIIVLCTIKYCALLIILCTIKYCALITHKSSSWAS